MDTIPQKPTDSIVDFRVRIPRTTAHGARIDWPTLCKYRRASSPLYRAYLSVVALMDRTAHKGAPITRQIGTPLLKADGQLKRKRGGRIVRDNETLIVHPQAGMVQALSDADLARLIGLDPAVRVNLTRARRAFEQLEADGVFEGEWTKGGKMRVFGPKRGLPLNPHFVALGQVWRRTGSRPVALRRGEIGATEDRWGATAWPGPARRLFGRPKHTP